MIREMAKPLYKFIRNHSDLARRTSVSLEEGFQCHWRNIYTRSDTSFQFGVQSALSNKSDQAQLFLPELYAR